MKKISKQQWLEVGLEALGEGGDAAIRIDFLCKRLKVTKGSFYHHFENIDAYITALMQYWEDENTHAIISATELATSIEEKPSVLNQLVLAKSQTAEVLIRSWAARNAQVQQNLHKVDELRRQYLQKLYLEQGISLQRAQDLAKIEYATFVGMQHLYMHLPVKELERLGEVFQQLMNK